MRQRKGLRGSEWSGDGFDRWGSKEGRLCDHRITVELEEWFDSAFKDFIYNEMVGRKKE
ncbi:MAG: hypothetical protein M3270_03320 [Thermoproteota archaeon]|nr:hypothetical protein [Thermoproteota archaeon]